MDVTKAFIVLLLCLVSSIYALDTTVRTQTKINGDANKYKNSPMGAGNFGKKWVACTNLMMTR